MLELRSQGEGFITQSPEREREGEIEKERERVREKREERAREYRG